MARFSQVFHLTNNQSLLDFVDVDLDRDKPLYLDPYALQIKNDEWSSNCADQVRSFFGEVLEALRSNNNARATHLLSNLHEPNETCFGVSKGRPRGRAIGEKKAGAIAHSLRRSRAFTTGLLGDLSEAELFIHGIGPDTVSDLVTNVCRQLLCDYTVRQCRLHNISLHETNELGPVWNSMAGDWKARPHHLPRHDGRPIVLVPKFSVRRQLALNSQEFYNHHMTEYLKAEYLNSNAALVQTLKDGTPYVTKKRVKEIHPFVKNDLADFVKKHPDVLDRYKKLKGAEGPLPDDEFYRIVHGSHFDEGVFASALIGRLANIPTGTKDANLYHDFAMGISTFLFYPMLVDPVKEASVHDGRKRIDIRYTNAATEGFFHSVMSHPSTRANSVVIECKNYGKEIANAELDQLSGRFSPQRGKIGFLFCRELNKRDRFIARCKDTAADDRGQILVFQDTDLIEMLTLVSNGQRSAINAFLNRRQLEIL